MRHIPIIAAVLAAAVLAPIAASADRMWVGFHDDPILRYDADRQSAMRDRDVDEQRVDPAHRSSRGPTSRRRSPRTPRTRSTPRIASTTSTSSSATRRQNNAEVLMTLWGTPKWANGNKSRNYLPKIDGRLPELRQGGRDSLLRAHRRLPVRPVLRDLERVEPRALPEPAVQLEGRRSSARPPTRSSRQPATPGSRPATRRRSSRSARPRRAGATRRRRARATPVRPGTFAQMVAKANKKLKFDAWAHHPYPVPVNQKPTQKVQVAERRAHLAAAVRDVARHVVRAQEHPDLDHRVRQRDEAGRAEGRHGGAAGGVHPAGDRDREEGHARARCSSGS